MSGTWLCKLCGRQALGYRLPFGWQQWDPGTSSAVCTLCVDQLVRDLASSKVAAHEVVEEEEPIERPAGRILGRILGTVGNWFRR